VSKSYEGLKEYKNYSIDLKAKRTQLQNVIQKVDIECKKRTVFDSIKIFNLQTTSVVVEFKQILELKKKERFLGYIQYYKNRKQELQMRHDALKEATEKRIKHRFILTWVSKYDIQWNIKDLKFRREQTMKISWFMALFKQVSVKKTCSAHLLQKNNQMKAQVMEALLDNMDIGRVEKRKEALADR